MRKFKHKITGKIASQITNIISYSVTNESHTYPSWMIENSNDWEEEVDCKCTKDYEIVTSEPISKLLPETFGNNQKILIIKRLSDNEVFVIGEMVKFNTKNLQIIGFFINGKSIRVLCKVSPFSNISVDLSEIQKAKTKLFTTEDNIDIYEGDTIFEVNTSTFEYIGTRTVSKINTITFLKCLCPEVLHFSTKEKAEEYVLWNKPCLSLHEVSKNSNKPGGTTGLKERLKEIVKQKINK